MIVNIEQASKLIQSGDIVAIPTETVYGLAADAFNIGAVKKTFDVKGRPVGNPLIVHISNLGHLKQLALEFPEDARLLTKTFWPGPLTIVLKKIPEVPDIVTAGLNTVAIRMPNHDKTLALIEKTGPLTAPSANKSGRPSPTRAEHIEEDYNSKIPVLDGGPSEIGLESTVIDLSEGIITLLRPGYVTSEMIRSVTGKTVIHSKMDGHKISRSPGTRYTHYKPKAKVCWFRTSTTDFSPGAYFLFHSDNPGFTGKNCFSYNGDYAALARDLYDHFRTADYLGYSQIFIESFRNFENHPIIPALLDRIQRAIS
ncbi:MAG: threonylcarbamoyl-AMP synthase [Balneolaceae bacterium]|nr:MAG: threonylcarbamoyl-AMP synthase [Balneolaceae bacterium]